VILRRVLPGLVLVLAALYAAIPPLAGFIVPRAVAASGISISHISFGYPSWNGVDVDGFDLRVGGVAVAGQGGRITYRLGQLLGGRLEAVKVARLTVRLGGEKPTAATGPFELPPFWALVPADRVSIDELELASTSPAAEARGTLHFDPDVLKAHLDVASPLLALPLTVNAMIYRDGRLAVAVLQKDFADPLIALTGAPDQPLGVLALDGRVALSGAPLTLAAAYVGMTLASGNVSMQLDGSAPWPTALDSVWRHFSGTGRYAIALQGAMPNIPAVVTQLSGDFAVHDGTVAAQLAAGSAVHADLPALQAFVGTRDVPRITLAADDAVAVEYSDAGLRVGDGLVLSSPVAASSVSVRVRGARGADGHVELAVTTQEGAPVLLATARSDGPSGLAAHAHVALTGKLLGLVAGRFGATGAGELVADFDGTAQSPDVSELQNVSGKGHVALTMTGRMGTTRTFDTNIEGDYTLDAGRLVATIAPGAHVLLAADKVEATTIAAVTVDAALADQQIDVTGVDFKLALPVIELGQRQVALTDAWVTASRLSKHGDTVAADVIVRTHAGRDAQPVHVTLSHDLGKGVGHFAVAADWQAKKPLLAAQLPGFHAPYDLDEGTLHVDLDGGWDAGRKPSFHGAGHVRLDGRRAHYADYAVAGIAADLPVTLDDAGYALANAPVSIDTIDVGFPLRQITLNLAVADKVARVRDLGGAVLGGRFAADPFGYVLATDEADVDLRVTGIDLAQVLALEGEDVQGTGVLDGELPVRLAGDVVTVTDGNIAARAPGGTLVYKSAASASLAAQAGMGFVFQALEDFHYTVLDAKVALATDGALVLAVRLQGRNPAVEDGRAIAFNLNLNESLPALLQSLRAADNITKGIEGKLSQ
jgi:hypothetical protein